MLCPGHGLPCIRLTVSRESTNKGRSFFKCSQRDAQCDFFQWADEGRKEGCVGRTRGGERGGITAVILLWCFPLVYHWPYCWWPVNAAGLLQCC